jgi:hypothetical protein
MIRASWFETRFALLTMRGETLALPLPEALAACEDLIPRRRASAVSKDGRVKTDVRRSTTSRHVCVPE